MTANKQTVLITGAAGNLGHFLAKDMVNDEVELRLLWHSKPIDPMLLQHRNVKAFQADLSQPETLTDALEGVDTVVHFAGVLFQARPEKFLPITNTRYFSNLLAAAVRARVRRIVLISFPHVEGETTPEYPANGRLDGHPDSAHARTRLEEERLLMGQEGIERVVLRCGMVYGRGVLMVDVARWFSKYGLLGIWRKPNCIHLIATDDFTAATKAAVYNLAANGIYQIGDDGIQTLHEFLDRATRQWHTCRPWVMPDWMIDAAASFFEAVSALTGWRAPLTRDFVKIGKVSYYGNTERMKQDLLPVLKYPTLEDGINTL